jgi:hypothetical protein
MAGTLGSQLTKQGYGQQQQRLTRTQRLVQRDTNRKEFEKLKERAKELQSTEFSNVTFEEYKTKYQNLSPELKQFFLSPEEIVSSQEQKKAVEIGNYNKKIEDLRQKIERKRQELEKYRNDFYSESDKYQTRNKKSFKQNVKEYEMDIEEYENTLRFAEDERGKLDSGISSDDIFNYVENKSYDIRQRSESRQKAVREFSENLASGKLDEDLIKLGLNKEKVNLTNYTKEVEKYNKNVSYLDSLKVWTGKVGFENISKSAQEKLNPSAVEFQQKYPNEKLVFDDSGNVIAVKSELLKGTIPIEKYQQKKTWEDYDYSKLSGELEGKTYYLQPTYPTGTVNIKNSPLGTIYGKTLGVGVEKIKSGYSWLNKNINLDIKLSGSPTMPKVSFFSFGEKETSSEKNIDVWYENLNKIEKDLDTSTIGSEKISKFETEKQQKYEDIYQTAFQRTYGKQIIYGEISDEEAQKKFQESELGKSITNSYNKEYQEGYKQLQTDVPYMKGTLAGAGYVGLEIGKFGLKTIRSPTRLGVTIGAVYGAGALYGAIPSTAKLGLTSGLFGYGAYQTLKPSSTYIERGAGAVTMAFTGYSLSKTGLNYLKSPVIKTKVVKAPKPTLDTYAVGKEGRLMLVKGEKEITAIQRVTYGNQKLSQTGISGRRTILTTKWRELSNKYLKTNINSIYEGIPTNQRAIYGSDVFRGGRYKITPSGYEKAMKKLTDYGYTSSQAKSTLRYYSPRVIETTLERGDIWVIGDKKAVGTFKYRIDKPVYTVDENLGIKTRGGRSVRETYNFEREVKGEVKGLIKIEEVSGKTTAFVTKKGASYNTLAQAGKTKTGFRQLSAVQSTELKDGLRKIPIDYGVYKVEPYNYQDLSQIYQRQQIIPFKRKVDVGISKSEIIKNMEEPLVFDYKDYLQQTRSFSVYRVTDKLTKNKIIKTPISKTFGTNVEKVKNIVKEKFIFPKSISSDVERISNRMESVSKYAGTGMYERTDSVAGTINLPSQNQMKALKTAYSPPKTTTKIADLIKVKIDNMYGLGFAEVLVSGSALSLKNELGLKSDLGLKSILKTDMSFKQDIIQKQTPALKTAMGLNLALEQPLINIPSINPSIPITPRIKPPKITPISFIEKERIKSRINKKRKGIKTSKTIALFPDFTARAIGLEPKQLSVKDAIKEMQKIQTGFEVRTGARIKGYSPIDEKSLLRGVMK